MLSSLVLSALVLANLASATITNFRATIPGSLHQCDATNVFFFDTDDTGSKTLLFVSPSDATSLGTGILTLTTVLASVPVIYQVDDITSADASEFDFTLKIPAGTAFSTLAFLSTGQGKNVDLDRTVMQPLPTNANCLSAGASTAVPTIIPTSTASSRFVTSTLPRTSVTALVSQVPVSTPTVVVHPTASPPIVTASTTTPAAPSSTIVIDADYLLTSFITYTNNSTTDGAITSKAITGGHVTGNVNATILSFGSALFTPNTTAAASSVASSDQDDMPILISASYSILTSTGQSIFVMAQSPLSANFTSQALIMTFQSANGTTSFFDNSTIIGQPEFINSTMLRIDAYAVVA